MFKPSKYPIGCVFSVSVAKADSIQQPLERAIIDIKGAGLILRGPNMEKAFRLLVVKPDRPYFKMNHKK